MNSKSRVFLINVDPGEAVLLSARLPADEYQIRVPEGDDLLTQLTRNLPDVILIDAMLPGMDGYALIRTIKQTPKLQDAAVILLTAQYDTEDKVRGLEAGVDEFLNRPVDAVELHARIKSLIALRRYEEQLHARLRSEQFFSALASAPEPAHEKTILLVEDDEVAARLVVSCLKDHPYRIEHFTDGASAIQWAETHDVDLALLDILLPGIDGFEVCQRLKRTPHLAHTQIVMITCLTEIESKIRGIELGVDDFLVKPINKEVLTARARALLRKKASLDQLAAEYAHALHSAITDPLTGLYNHGYFKQFLKLETERSLRQRHPLTLMLLDLDDFKYYNDTLGHLAGDRILQEFSHIITLSIRQIDMAARYGGEEFGIVLPYTDLQGAAVAAERLRQMVEAYAFAYTSQLPDKHLTVSIGLSCFTAENRESVDQLIHRADRALYQAKASGKNQVRTHPRA